jgi:hypothetical protein
VEQVLEAAVLWFLEKDMTWPANETSKKYGNGNLCGTPAVRWSFL